MSTALKSGKMLGEVMWNKKILRTVKIRVYKTLIWPVLFYSINICFKQKQRKDTKGDRNVLLQWIAGILLKDYWINEGLTAKNEVVSITEKRNSWGCVDLCMLGGRLKASVLVEHLIYPSWETDPEKDRGKDG